MQYVQWLFTHTIEHIDIEHYHNHFMIYVSQIIMLYTLNYIVNYISINTERKNRNLKEINGVQNYVQRLEG